METDNTVSIWIGNFKNLVKDQRLKNGFAFLYTTFNP